MNDDTTFTIERFDILSHTARTLIEALNAELSSRYPEDGATHFRLDPDEVAEGRGAFLVASRAGKPVGCGAVRRIDRTGLSPAAHAAAPGSKGRTDLLCPHRPRG